jgi:hypothetical protein
VFGVSSPIPTSIVGRQPPPSYKFVDANLVKTKDAQSMIDKLVESSLSEGDLSNATNEGCCKSFFDG